MSISKISSPLGSHPKYLASCLVHCCQTSHNRKEGRGCTLPNSTLGNCTCHSVCQSPCLLAGMPHCKSQDATYITVKESKSEKITQVVTLEVIEILNKRNQALSFFVLYSVLYMQIVWIDSYFPTMCVAYPCSFKYSGISFRLRSRPPVEFGNNAKTYGMKMST